MRNAPSPAASLLLVLAVAATSLRAQSVYDDFNGTQLDPKLWEIEEAPNFSVAGGLLRVRTPPLQADSDILSVVGFEGDFEYVLDFRNFNATATVFGALPSFELNVKDASRLADSYFFVMRALAPAGHLFLAGGELNGIPQPGATAPATAAAGLLRIQRVGSTLTTSYDDGAGWKTLRSYAAFPGVARVEISSYSGDNGTFQVDSDRITFLGKIVPPPNAMFGNGCHGLQAGWENWAFVGSNHFALGYAGAKPQAAAGLIVGASNTMWGPVPLPLPLAPIAPGCSLLVSFDLQFTGPTADQNGEGLLRLPIPPDQNLRGLRFFGQWITADPAANLLGWVWSPGFSITIL